MGFATAQRLFRRGQVDRAEVVDPGQRVAAVDQVPQVPVAAARQRHAPGAEQREPPPPTRRQRDQPEHEHRCGKQVVELRPRRKPDREANHEQGPGRKPTPSGRARGSVAAPAAPSGAPPPPAPEPPGESADLTACPLGLRIRPDAAAAPRSSRAAAAFNPIATAASRKKIPTMSLRASPAWSARAGTLSAIAPSASDQGATRNGRPMHQQASRQPSSQPRFSSGDIRSREKASIPIAWATSPFAG